MIEDPLWPRVDQWLAGPDREPEVSLVGVPTSAASLSPSRADLNPDAVRTRLGRFSTFHGDLGFDLATVPIVDRRDLEVGAIPHREDPDEVAHLIAELPTTAFTLCAPRFVCGRDPVRSRSTACN